jgi:hypothetical protein
VTGLDGENAASDTEKSRIAEEGGGTEIGAHADALEHRGRGEHGGGVCKGGGEVVFAAADGGDAGLGEGGLEEGDVLGLGEADGLDVEELLGGEAETEELIVGEGGEGLLVEGILEMFQRESAVTRLVSFFLSLSPSLSLFFGFDGELRD